MNTLRDNITKEEFFALANREPNLDGSWIYQLEMTELGDGPHLYPRFKVGPTTTKDFSTIAQTEKYMREQSAQTPMYRSRITQIPEGSDISERGAQWLYDSNGTLIDCTTIQKAGSAEETHFFGRPFENQRLGPGDVVELLDGDTVSLAIVFFPIRPPEDCWAKYKIEGSDYDLGYRSDAHTIVTDHTGKIEHALITALMPPRYEITPKLADKMAKWFSAVFDHPERHQGIKIIPVYDEEEEIPADPIPMTDEEIAELEEELRKAKLRRGF